MPGGKRPGPSIKRPAAYESIKKKLMADGLSEDEAKRRAAAISNSQAMNRFMRTKRRR